MMNDQTKNFSVDLNPEDVHIAELLDKTARQIELNPNFQAALENRLKDVHRPKGIFSMSPRKLLPTLGWAIALIVLVIALNWAIRSLAPEPVPAAAGTGTLVSPSEEPVSTPITTSSTVYDWRGTSLSLSVPLPDSPAEASVHLLNKDQPATLDEARALAQRFGIQSEAYTAPGQILNTTDYVFTDGKQMLSVHSNFYFTYVSDIVKNRNFNGSPNQNAEAIITEFLKSHGFDSSIQVEADGLRGGYIVQQLAPDGIPMQYEFYSPPVMDVTLDENGQVLRIDASLMDYDQTPVGTFGILSADEALQKLLDDSVQAGKIESVHSVSKPIKEWNRVYPVNEPITIYGYVASIPALDSSKPAFIQIDGYAATGNVNGLDALDPNTYVKASGQFVVENEIQKFKIETWDVSEKPEDGLVGTLHREGTKVLLTTTDQGEFTLVPDAPADLPLPFENAFVIGVAEGNTFDWKSIDDRATSGGGGGGGGGGLGFYKLNLTGTPVPFPTLQSVLQLNSGGGGGGGGGSSEQIYKIQAGDTLSKIASEFGVSVEALSQANGISDPSTIYIGQTLVIPGTQSAPQEVNPPSDNSRVDGLRGILSVTIHKKADGSQTTEYELTGKDNNGQYLYVILTGSLPQNLSTYQGLPIIVSGTATTKDQITTVNVEQHEIPFPDLKFQILKGTQKTIDIQGQPAILFTTEDGKSYVQANPNGDMDATAFIGQQGDQVLLETLAIPDEKFGAYPAIRVFSASMAVSPKNGQPLELSITADQPYIIDDTQNPANPPQTNYTPPALTIEKVELVYFVSNPLFQANDPTASYRSPYIQPAWHFYGHYSNGDAFDILIQALKQEFLTPEIAPYVQGG